MASNGTILLISPDQLLFKLLKSMWSSNRFDIIRCDRFENAVSVLTNLSPVMVLVDKSLAEVNGNRLCREIRKAYAGTLIVLAEHDDELDEVTAFEIGADDYIRKSVHSQILLARVNRLLIKVPPQNCAKKRSIAIGRIVVDPSKREVSVNDRPVRLTSIQFDLLWHLANNCGQVVTRDDLNRLLYNKAYDGLDRSIDVYISRIRQKLGDDPAQPVYLKTVRGVGYLFLGKVQVLGEVRQHPFRGRAPATIEGEGIGHHEAGDKEQR
jgi:DNA-binding response OmpR family regulator